MARTSGLKPSWLQHVLSVLGGGDSQILARARVARPMGVARHTQQRQLRRTTARSLSRNAIHRGLASPSARILRYCLGRRHMPPDSPPADRSSVMGLYI